MSTDNSKPDWFQMAEADAFEPKPATKKALRIMALATPLFVLGAGLAYAQSQINPNVVATAGSTTSLVTATSSPASSPIHITSLTLTTQSASITIRKPAIKLPSGGDEND
jgi:hypothetical protein